MLIPCCSSLSRRGRGRSRPRTGTRTSTGWPAALIDAHQRHPLAYELAVWLCVLVDYDTLQYSAPAHMSWRCASRTCCSLDIKKAVPVLFAQCGSSKAALLQRWAIPVQTGHRSGALVRHEVFASAALVPKLLIVVLVGVFWH